MSLYVLCSILIIWQTKARSDIGVGIYATVALVAYFKEMAKMTY